MLKKLLLAAALGASLVMAASAQGDREAFPFHRDPFPISTVELVETGEGLELVIRGELPDGCMPEPTVKAEVVGTTLFVDLYRDVPFDRECTAVITPYEQRVDASALLEMTDDLPAVTVLVVNGRIFGVDYPINDGIAKPMLNELLVRGPLPYREITIRHTMEADMEITLTGDFSDGCPIPVYRAVEDYQNPDFVMVEAYSVVNIAAMCLQAITPFEAVMRSPGFYSIAINGVSVPFRPEISVDRQFFVEEQLNVENASAQWVEGILPNVLVTVSGTTDGCDFPVQVVAVPGVETTYYVKVVRVVPVDTACTQEAVPFTGEVYIAPEPKEVPEITLFVNGEPLTVKGGGRE